MCGVPRPWTRAAALAVVVTDRAKATRHRPGTTGGIGSEPAVFVRTGEHVVDAPVHQTAMLVQGGLEREVVLRAVKIVDAARDLHALHVVPGTSADPIARVDCRPRIARRHAEIRTPFALWRAGSARQRRTVRIGGIQPTEIATITSARAGDEETHPGCVIRRSRAPASQDTCDEENRRNLSSTASHVRLDTSFQNLHR